MFDKAGTEKVLAVWWDTGQLHIWATWEQLRHLWDMEEDPNGYLDPLEIFPCQHGGIL